MGSLDLDHPRAVREPEPEPEPAPHGAAVPPPTSTGGAAGGRLAIAAIGSAAAALLHGAAAGIHADTPGLARLFVVPGMAHCRGGLATDRFDALSALVKWVEQGEAPERIVASARGAGDAVPNPEQPAAWAPNRTRPLCAWPKVARYTGSGDPERAENFQCR